MSKSFHKNYKFDIKKKEINIDSDNRNSGTGSNFNINLNMPMNNKFSHVSLCLAEIPKSYYLFEDVGASVGHFKLTEAGGGTATNSPVNITPGNYTDSTLATELQTKLNADASASTYTVTANTNTKKFTITKTSGGTFTLTFTSPAFARIFGLVNGANASTLTVLTSTNSYNLQRHNVIYLRSNLAQNYNDSTLSTIFPNSYSDGNIIKYFSPDVEASAKTISNNNYNAYDFAFVDSEGKDINLNGLGIRFTLICYEGGEF